MSKDEESSVDSELAALLDEELFSEGGAATAAEEPAADEAAAEEQQQHKRPRWAGRTPEPIELDDDDKAFLEEVGCDQESSESDANAEQQQEGQQGMQDTAGYVCPPHPGWWMNMCIRCGATRPEADPTDPSAAAANKAALTKIKHLHHKQALEVSLQCDVEVSLARPGYSRYCRCRYTRMFTGVQLVVGPGGELCS